MRIERERPIEKAETKIKQDAQEGQEEEDDEHEQQEHGEKDRRAPEQRWQGELLGRLTWEPHQIVERERGRRKKKDQ